MLTHGSLFSGIGGIDKGFERAGIKTVWQCEIDDKASELLALRFPGVPNYRDVREVKNDGTIAIPDIISGGFPCQDVSLNGERLGLDGKRSTLWSEFARIICEFRPKWVVAENVRGLLSANDGEFFGNILRDLANIRYDAEWTIIPTGYFCGLPHQRERVFIIAYPAGERWNEARVFNGGTQKHSWFSREHSCTNDKEIWRLSEADVCREIDGFPDWVDRLKQCGNAVVPPMAEWIGRRLVQK